jgi:hypothetical protein
MDFVERLLGLSPDGGTGLFELAWLLVPPAGVACLCAWRRRHADRADAD